MIRYIFILLLSMMILGAAAQSDPGAILWDSYGVPHIYARNEDQMYYEFGWAQMHNHANLILRLYGMARGRAAAYWGENFLASDKQVLLFRLPAMAEKIYKGRDPSLHDRGFNPMLDQFVKGINDYASAHPEAISPENKQVLPVTATDVISHEIRVVFLRFVAGDELGTASRKGQAGSNALAISPGRTVAGNALLLANPHLPWGDLYTFFEAHLQCPGFNAYGAAVVGLPALNIAFNEHLGWTLTVNTIDACDRYELKTQGDSYLLDSAWIPFEKQAYHLQVRHTDGTLEEQTLECRYSRHGPILGLHGDKAYAMRIAGMENPDLFYQWHKMGKATNWASFEAALKMMQIPMFNIIYADEGGHILYLFDGNVPVRSEGNWTFWSDVVDGSYSRLIWQKTLPYEALPKLFDPSTGFIQNANDPPWTCTYPCQLVPGNYPAYLSPVRMALRPQRAVNMIRPDSKITLHSLAAYKLNTGMEAADRFLPALLAAASSSADTLVMHALAVLKSWDKTTLAASRGGVLFARWFDKLTPGMFLHPWSPEKPVETPSGLKDTGQATALLSQAAREVLQDYDSLNVAWGDVYRLRIGKMDYPASGGPEQYGIYRTLYFKKDADKKFRAVAGDSYVAVTEFGKKVKALVLLSYGNASQPGNKHVGDQLIMLSRNELRPAWLEKEDILKHLEETERFGPSAGK